MDNRELPGLACLGSSLLESDGIGFLNLAGRYLFGR